MVEYREILGYPGYLVGSDATVWSCRAQSSHVMFRDTWRKLKLSPSSQGYLRVTVISGQGKKRRTGVHRLMAEVFLTKPEGATLVRHLNDVNTDNQLDNLAWGTRKDNGRDARRNGRYRTGQDHQNTNLTVAQVDEMIRLRAEGKTYEEIGRLFGKRKGNVWKLVNGMSWSYHKRS